jgi:hypothetical protein
VKSSNKKQAKEYINMQTIKCIWEIGRMDALMDLVCIYFRMEMLTKAYFTMVRVQRGYFTMPTEISMRVNIRTDSSMGKGI